MFLANQKYQRPIRTIPVPKRTKKSDSMNKEGIFKEGNEKKGKF